ncbi:uncharacterized protein KD926_009798 [Aspergillus affinis]|uniref:uncharacterized protein n=1 Tax=Aspergillus affinis TaxID=1070780 RepID=UPI0022FE0069|nr:uncharacterized protein KD926_009798 [Aspergillus affinis]KAI9039257.1 hypothetical protein KD926_009798 [Aspergillus affinis]
MSILDGTEGKTAGAGNGNEAESTNTSTAAFHVGSPANDTRSELKKLGFPRFNGQSVPKSDAMSSVDSDMTMMKLPLAQLATRGTKKSSSSPISPPPLSTAIKPAQDLSERGTPRAQTMQDFEDIDSSSHSNNLEDIPEGTDALNRISVEVGTTSHGLNWDVKHVSDGQAEIRSLKAALTECWSLCNTLASLSYIHQHRLNCKDDVHEEAWKSCWTLCRELYNSQCNDHGCRVNSTLDTCRSFCQTLFDARDCDDELADSVLRVSFELNNHLYNTHDRNLPDAFRERTLDFYITLCHRLMKQRTGTNDSDSLLSACWSLAEMLFSIRQAQKGGRVLDEELLGSAVQACWDLCDIYREGWSRRGLRNSDRGTPRPSQTTYPQIVRTREKGPSKAHLNDKASQQGNPETPTTIFEDTAAASPDEAPLQNIFVLGQGLAAWRSNSSSISEQSQSSEHSTNTIKTSSNDLSLGSLRILMAKAAINCGYLRDGPQSLPSFIKSLSSDAFGSMSWQLSLLKNYKRTVAIDPCFREIGLQARASATEIANAAQLAMQAGRFPWLGDLYRFVFGFHLDEAIGHKDIMLEV